MSNTSYTSPRLSKGRLSTGKDGVKPKKSLLNIGVDDDNPLISSKDVYSLYGSKRSTTINESVGTRSESQSLQSNQSTKSTSANPVSSRLEQEIIEEVNVNPFVSFFDKKCGLKCGNFIQKIIDVFSCCLRLDKRNTIIEKLQRTLVIGFMFCCILYCGYYLYDTLTTINVYFIIPKNVTTEEMIFNSTNNLTYYQNVTTTGWYFGRPCLQALNILISFVIFLLSFVLNFIFPKVEKCVGFITMCLTIFVLSFSLFIYQDTLLSGCALALTVLPLFMSFFVFEKNFVKVIIIFIYTCTIVSAYIYDVLNEYPNKQKLLDIYNSNYQLYITLSYVSIFTPTFLLLGFYGLRICIEVKYLQKITKTQRKAINKFKILEDDLETLIAEKKTENDVSIAHLKINHKLFEVEYDELKIKKKIGEGGSHSIVYLADWNGQEVAFKCFKLYDFLEQDKFRDFEREVGILASISHPNILRFYGATLQVGIVMEYCKHGDMREFLKKYKRDNAVEYPFVEKVRMVEDVFSFGIMLFCIITENFHPYGQPIESNLEFKVANDPTCRPKINFDDFQECIWMANMIKRCWLHNGEERPNFSELLEILEQNTGKSSSETAGLGGGMKRIGSLEMFIDKVVENKTKVNLEAEDLKKTIKLQKKELQKFFVENKELKKEIQRLNELLEVKNTLKKDLIKGISEASEEGDEEGKEDDTKKDGKKEEEE